MVGIVQQLVEVRNSPIAGKGLFALKDIRKGARIIEYTGEKISKEEGDRRSTEQGFSGKPMVIFELTADFDLDASVGGSGAEFANHSCAPNAESETSNGRIFLLAKRDIKTGEEIVYDYNFDASADREECLCNSKFCRGSINEAKGALRHRKRRYEKRIILTT